MRRRWSYPLFSVAALLVFVSTIHSFLAVHEPIGAPVLVVEGWLTERQLEEASRIIIEGGHDHIYTTGTIRPFNHYLGNGDTLWIELRDPFSGSVILEVAGVEGGGFDLLASGTSILEGTLSTAHRAHEAHITVPVTTLAITTSNLPGRGLDLDNMFIRDLRLEGNNAHHLASGGEVKRANGITIPLTPTHAVHARERLATLGVPRDRITAVPVYGKPLSRSWSSAAHFAHQAAMDGVSSFDIVTMGVHGRRSRFIYRKACGNGFEVGVITLIDHMCPPQGWWKNFIGWFLVMKEVASLPVVMAIALLR